MPIEEVVAQPSDGVTLACKRLYTEGVGNVSSRTDDSLV